MVVNLRVIPQLLVGLEVVVYDEQGREVGRGVITERRTVDITIRLSPPVLGGTGETVFADLCDAVHLNRWYNCRTGAEYKIVA